MVNDTSMQTGAAITKLTRSVVLLSAAVCFSIAAAVLALYFMVNQKTIAIAVDARGVVVPMVPIGERMISESRVVGFVDECIRKAFQHDFLHFQNTIPVAQECFTPTAADAFAVSMQTWIKLMLEKRMVMSVSIKRPPRVINAYWTNTGGTRVANWDIQAEIEIFFEGRNERIPPSVYIAEVTVQRVSMDATPRGILIEKFSLGSK